MHFYIALVTSFLFLLFIKKYATAKFGIQHNQATIRYAEINSPVIEVKIGSQILNVTAAKHAA